MTDKELEQIREMSEKFFGTQSDPDQIPIGAESTKKLESIHKDACLFKLDEKGNPIGWVTVVPTSIETMDKFLDKKITEVQLLEEAMKEKKFEALYLCGIFVLPEYRRKGYAKGMMIEVIEKVIGNNKDAQFYAWPYSGEGKIALKSLSSLLGKPIFERKD